MMLLAPQHHRQRDKDLVQLLEPLHLASMPPQVGYRCWPSRLTPSPKHAFCSIHTAPCGHGFKKMKLQFPMGRNTPTVGQLGASPSTNTKFLLDAAAIAAASTRGELNIS